MVLKNNLETFLIDIAFNSILEDMNGDAGLDEAKATNDPREISNVLYTKSIKILKEILDDIKVDTENASEKE